jgi:hypothetical protein
MPCPGHFTPGKEPGTHCTRGWVAPRLVWMGTQNLTPTRIRYPDRATHSKMLYRLCYPTPYDFLSTTLNLLTQSNESQKLFHYKLLIQTVEPQYFEVNGTKLPQITEKLRLYGLQQFCTQYRNDLEYSKSAQTKWNLEKS